MSFRSHGPSMRAAGCVVSSILATTALPAFGLSISPMVDSTGAPLISRLIAGSSINSAHIDPNKVDYIGLTQGGSQAGLFDNLVIQGAQGTSLSMGPGIVLSSGNLSVLPGTNTSDGFSWVTSTGGNNYFRDFPAQTGTSRHGGRLQEHDQNVITFEYNAPANVVGLKANFVYASDEFPEWSGTQYADGFAAIANDVNYAKLPDGRPVSLLREQDNIHFMTNGSPFDASVPLVAPLEYDGITRVLEFTLPLNAGQRNTITLVVADTGDEIYDSAAFITGFQVITGSVPIDPDDCHVRSRNLPGEDDLFLELNSSTVPEPLSLPLLAPLALLTARRR